MSDSESQTVTAQDVGTLSVSPPEPPKQDVPDISAFANILGDTSQYFVSVDEGRIPLIVRHVDGIPTHAVDLLVDPPTIVAMDAGGRELIAERSLAAGVRNRPGFKGFPEFNREDPQYKIETYASELGDTSKYFVCFDDDFPRVVENETGKPKYHIKEGKLVLYAPYVAPTK